MKIDKFTQKRAYTVFSSSSFNHLKSLPILVVAINFFAKDYSSFLRKPVNNFASIFRSVKLCQEAVTKPATSYSRIVHTDPHCIWYKYHYAM